MRRDDGFFEGPEDSGWSDERPPIRASDREAGPGWASCTGFDLTAGKFQAGTSRDGDLLVAIPGTLTRRPIDRRRAERLFEPLAEGTEEVTPGLVLDRHEAYIRISLRGVVLGKVDVHGLAVAWNLRPVVKGRPKPFRGYE